MQLIKKLEIQSKYRIIKFLNSEPVGRIASIDANGFPQVIPMNFVFVQANDPRARSRRIIKLDAVYMHSHPFGEKLAREILDVMGIDILADGNLKIRKEPSM